LPARRRKALVANPVYRASATAITFVSVLLLWPFFRFPFVEACVWLGRLLFLH
jgi:hypothetical protein